MLVASFVEAIAILAVKASIVEASVAASIVLQIVLPDCRVLRTDCDCSLPLVAENRTGGGQSCCPGMCALLVSVGWSPNY